MKKTIFLFFLGFLFFYLVPLISSLQATIVNYNFTTNLSDRNAYLGYPTASQTFNNTGPTANASAAQYTALGVRGGTTANVWARGANDFPFERFNFTAKELGGQNRSWIQWLTVNVTGFDNATAAEIGQVMIFNFSSNANVSVGTLPDSSAANVSKNFSGTNLNATNLIHSASNNITVYVEGPAFDAIDGLFIDFVQVDVMYLKDVLPPNSSGNMTNSTVAGSTVLHSVLWSDETPMNYSTFSLDNGNGSFLNYTLTTIGSTNWSNFSYVVNSTVGTTIRWRVYANDSWIVPNNLNVSDIFQYTTSSDSCTCTDGVDWTIINGDQCTLATTCNLGTGRLRIMDGALRIANTGVLNAFGCYVQSTEVLHVVAGGKLTCR